jgi:hypothetical protein
VLVYGLLNDRFPAGTQAFCPRSPPQRQERRDLATVRWCVRRSNPHTRRGLTPRHVAAAATSAVVLGVLLASAMSRSRRRVASAQSASL